MRILKITTHWTTEEAACLYDLLAELQAIIWEHYGDDITQMHHQMTDEPQELDGEETLNDEIPF